MGVYLVSTNKNATECFGKELELAGEKITPKRLLISTKLCLLKLASVFGASCLYTYSLRTDNFQSYQTYTQHAQIYGDFPHRKIKYF